MEVEERGGKLSRDFTLVTRENGIKTLFFWNSSLVVRCSIFNNVSMNNKNVPCKLFLFGETRS